MRSRRISVVIVRHKNNSKPYKVKQYTMRVVSISKTKSTESMIFSKAIRSHAEANNVVTSVKTTHFA
jgi:hypothetical protein